MTEKSWDFESDTDFKKLTNRLLLITQISSARRVMTAKQSTVRSSLICDYSFKLSFSQL